MIRFSPVLRIGVGLAFLTVSLVLVGDLIGLFPDPSGAVLDARKKVCESLAVQLSAATTKGETDLVGITLRAFVERNEDVLSAALRSKGGTVVAEAGEHAKHWVDVSDLRSTPTHIKVPILQADQRWGAMEVSFTPHKAKSLWGLLRESVYGLTLFIALTGFVGYVFVLRRTMRELDPEAVIPERVKAALDALTEGVLILDEKEHIVLANKTFADKAERSTSSLIGVKASELRWRGPEGEVQLEGLPWIEALREGASQKGILLSLRVSEKVMLAFSVNGALIRDDKGHNRGVLVTFDDITELERRNVDLREAVARLRDSEREVRRKAEELHHLATRDPLTGCLNRRSFFDALESLFQGAKREKLELSCIMADIDHFKAINDTHGHAVGDDAIKFVAELLGAESRSDDIVGRYGGEEFCILLRGLNSDQASAIAERIRIAVQRESEVRFGSTLSITASFGVSSLSDAREPRELIEQADQALYRAKRSGRNRVIRWPINHEAEDTVVDGDTPDSSLTHKAVAMKDEGAAKVYPFRQPVREVTGGHDELTGLPTGLLFSSRVAYALAHGQRYNKMIAVLSLRVDRPEDEDLEPTSEEQLLRSVSGQLMSILRRTDTVAHLGIHKSPASGSRFQANEFGILLTELDHTDSLLWVVKRILDKLSEPVALEHPMYLTTSLGISVYPHDGGTPETLIANAQAAEKRAASMGGRTRYQFFSRESNERACDQLLLETQLRRAIDSQELELHYQPKIHIATGDITGFEALVRWNHPARGLMFPAEFIPLAENSGLIAPLGKWVLHSACRQAREWLAHSPDLRVAVNLSAVQFYQANILREVQEILEATGLDPSRLELEITESAIMRNADKAALTLRDLAKLGVKLTIDDFGTGYSSLSYLRAFPVGSFKIDRSFLKDVHTDGDGRAKALYTAIATMAKSLGLQVVAEGVETPQQLDFVRQVQCDEVQGYLISEPVPSNHATKLASSWRHFISDWYSIRSMPSSPVGLPSGKRSPRTAQR